MSVQSELTRLQNAKAAIKAAIEGKGATVPDGTLLDGMAEIITNLPSGGGAVNFAPFSKIVWGTITPTTDLSGMIPASTFGLESVPNIQFANIQIASDSPANTGNILYAYAYSVNKTRIGSLGSKVGVYQTRNNQGTGKILVEYGSNFFISQTLGAGETYRYVICVE